METQPVGNKIPYPPDSVIYAGLAGKLDLLWHFILFELPPGLPVIPLRHAINLHKVLMLPVFLAFMAAAGDWECESYWQLACMHGFYGFGWVLKDYAFGDKSWNEKATVMSTIGSFIFLMVNHGAGSLVGGFNLVSYGCVEVPRVQRVVALFTFMLGFMLMSVSDMQKATQLKFRRGLIKDGLYAYMRNPNFLGEILIYISFALAIGADNEYWYLPWIATANVVAMLLPRMVTKDRRMSRYPDFAEWSQSAGFLLPVLG